MLWIGNGYTYCNNVDMVDDMVGRVIWSMICWSLAYCERTMIALSTTSISFFFSAFSFVEPRFFCIFFKNVGLFFAVASCTLKGVGINIDGCTLRGGDIAIDDSGSVQFCAIVGVLVNDTLRGAADTAGIVGMISGTLGGVLVGTSTLSCTLDVSMTMIF